MKALLQIVFLLWNTHSFAQSLMPPIDIVKIDQSIIESYAEAPFISEDNFVYRPIQHPFSMQTYFSDYSDWIVLEEDLLHWSGSMGVDPRIILTTLATTSGWSPESEATDSTVIDFKRDIKYLANRLSQLFYYAVDQNLSINQTVAYSILSSLDSNTSWSQWQSFYIEWFGEPISDQSKAESAQPNMQWPWRAGYNWIPNGPHSHTGSGFPLSSVDVSYDWPRWGGQTYSVTAAHDGYVSVFSRCQVRVTHPDGWATNYYHMDGIDIQDGEWVNKNQRIGRYASQKNAALCQGGSSTGPHLHFSVLFNGRFKSLQDLSLGPYRIDVGRYSYDNNCRYTWMTDSRVNNKQCFWSRIDNP
ncbi:M23 family metallopeptidase [Vibrio pectenicida]|uniref:M23 family metallopeptidase n=1 Tax=Vibrio pectenicida TaxID=62763 RepID=A0A7Y3ZZ87_9VIBR|nr:M23 family metallopeptidase [Vibrio pectenicida]NOH71633.1 M23 family metallopeptidase [Vibrio pectenicida]